MVHSVSQLTTITSVVHFCVNLPNGEKVVVTYIGTVQISSTLTLTDVLCVPSFNFNLISVSQLTKHKFCCLIFLGDWCFIQDLAQWSMIGLGKQSNGLYLLQAFVPPSRSTTLVTNVSHTSSSDLWHSRLGHLSLSKLQLLKHFVDIDVQNKATCCDVCHFSKQKRLSFPSSSHVTTKSFELIHYDLWGPFSVNTIDGYKYFFTIVDDYTRCT